MQVMTEYLGNEEKKVHTTLLESIFYKITHLGLCILQEKKEIAIQRYKHNEYSIQYNQFCYSDFI